MAERDANETLYAKGVAILEEHLGPIEALRFLAGISRQPFDYQHWRQQCFGAMSLEDILAQADALAKPAPQEP